MIQPCLLAELYIGFKKSDNNYHWQLPNIGNPGIQKQTTDSKTEETHGN